LRSKKVKKKVDACLTLCQIRYAHGEKKNNKNTIMKTKTLLITAAAALAAGIMSSQAQVYSQNVVGYINVPLATGYTFVANQLDLDGTGTNNSIYTTVGTNLPTGTQIFAWNGATFNQSKLLASGKWSANNSFFTNAVNPGSGIFVDVPSATNITLVGSVIQGTNTYPIVTGYQVVSPSGPIPGGIKTVQGYTPSVGDQVFVWNGTTFTQHKYLASGNWSGGGEPVFSVGEAVFLDSVSNTNWVQILNIQ
jgi:hypothetical protein